MRIEERANHESAKREPRGNEEEMGIADGVDTVGRKRNESDIRLAVASVGQCLYLLGRISEYLKETKQYLGPGEGFVDHKIVSKMIEGEMKVLRGHRREFEELRKQLRIMAKNRDCTLEGGLPG